MGTVFEEMSSWTALTWYLGMKTAYKTKYMRKKYVRSCATIIIFKNIIQKYILTIRVPCCGSCFYTLKDIYFL